MNIELPRIPSLRLDGRRALVTGAGRGIGQACAAALAEAGASVTLVARSGEEVEAVAEALRKRGDTAEARVLDVTDIEATRRVISEGPCRDVLVNNAGTNRPGLLVDLTPDNFDLIMDVNVRAAVFVTQAFVRQLLTEGRTGSIINIASQMGLVGAANRTIYSASKHALIGFTKALAVELGPSGIRVNAIAPTFIETPMTKPFFTNAEFRERTLQQIKLGRLGRVEDLMGAVVYLASDAAALVTGTTLTVDGGWTAE